MENTIQAADWKHLPLRDAYQFGAEHGLEKEISAIRDMEIEWDRSYTSSLRRGFIIELFEVKGIFQAFKDACWQNGNTLEGKRLSQRYLRIKRQYDDFLSGMEGPQGPEDDIQSEQEFAYESDLRDFLARNLSVLEPGLELFREGERKGIEYPVEGGRIDILAKGQDGRFVAIELKVSRGRNPTIGQLLYYMGWLDKNLPGKERSRGIIVAKEISDDLRLACERIPDVSLYRYALSVTATKVYPL